MNQAFIYVVLTDTGTLFTRLIKAYTRAPYNHASLALDNQLEEMFSFGRLKPNNPLRAGLVKEDVYSGVYSHFPATRCLVLKMKVSQEQKTELKHILYRYYAKREQYTYNLLGLLCIMMRIHYSSPNAYFCSEFVAGVLREAGISLWELPNSQITPHHFSQHPDLELVYEGMLCDYPYLDPDRKEGNLMLPQALATGSKGVFPGGLNMNANKDNQHRSL